MAHLVVQLILVPNVYSDRSSSEPLATLKFVSEFVLTVAISGSSAS